MSKNIQNMHKIFTGKLDIKHQTAWICPSMSLFIYRFCSINFIQTWFWINEIQETWTWRLLPCSRALRWRFLSNRIPDWHFNKGRKQRNRISRIHYIDSYSIVDWINSMHSLSLEYTTITLSKNIVLKQSYI